MSKKILNICVNGVYTDGLTYHENLLPKYHKMNGADVYIIASEFEFNERGEVRKAKKSKYIDTNGVKIVRLPIKYDRPITYRFKRFKFFYKTIQEIEPDIIFCHLFQFLDVAKVIKYKRKHPYVKVYFDSHADEVNSAHSWISRNVLHKMLWKRLARSAYKVSNVFYGVSPARLRFIREVYKLPEKKTKLLVMGADDRLVEEAQVGEQISITRKKYGVDESDCIIVTGGKIDKNKWQVINLIKVMRNFNARLIVFGSISDDMQKEMDMCMSDNVKCVGWLSQKESYNLFAIADLAVFPSTHSVYWEQAVGQGIPLVVKKWNGFEHIECGNNVEYLYEDSVDELHQVLNRVLEREYLSEMRKNAIEIGVPFFSYKRLAARSIEELQEDK